MFFKHFPGSNKANLKTFLTTTGWKRSWWRSWIITEWLPSPSSLAQLCGYQNCQVFVRWHVSSLVSSVELKIVAELFLSAKTGSPPPPQSGDSSYYDISYLGKNSEVESTLTSIKNYVAPGILIWDISSFIPSPCDGFVEIQLPRKMFCSRWIVNIFSLNILVLDYILYLGYWNLIRHLLREG